MQVTHLSARILNAVRNSFPGDTGKFRQKFGSTFSMSLFLSSLLCFQLAPSFKLFAFVLLSMAFFDVFDDDDEDAMPVALADKSGDMIGADDDGTCF